MNVETIGDHQFQYSDARHQAATAIAGLWLFLATEVLFFGALIVGWIFCRHLQPIGFDEGARETDRTIGTVNTVILISSSLSYAAAMVYLEGGQTRNFVRLGGLTAALGFVFLGLKGIEWHEDFAKHLFPGAGFAIEGVAAKGAALFFSFYFVATGLHAVHMMAGIGLMSWVLYRASHDATPYRHRAKAEVVGLYWSFVDIVWLVLYPLIYLIGRGA